jgi:putative Ca2+/H+ antiporter (TMEM165/GDT1 family)
MHQLIMIFMTVFLAELGDKTQITTLLYASDQSASKPAIFLASGAALLLSTGIAVIAGERLALILSPITAKGIAGCGLILTGFWMLLQTLS